MFRTGMNSGVSGLGVGASSVLDWVLDCVMGLDHMLVLDHSLLLAPFFSSRAGSGPAQTLGEGLEAEAGRSS